MNVSAPLSVASSKESHRQGNIEKNHDSIVISHKMPHIEL